MLYLCGAGEVVILEWSQPPGTARRASSSSFPHKNDATRVWCSLTKIHHRVLQSIRRYNPVVDTIPPRRYNYPLPSSWALVNKPLNPSPAPESYPH